MGLNKRSDEVVEIGVELQEVLPDPTDQEIIAAVEDCTGRELGDVEKALAVMAYEHGEAAAKASHWYRW